MRLSICHLRNQLYNYDLNYKNIETLYYKSLEEKADLVVYPESAFSGYDVIDTKNVSKDMFETEFVSLLKLFNLVRQFKVPVTIGCHFFDNDRVSTEAYFLITLNNIQLLKTKNKHNCINDIYSETHYNGEMFELMNVKFSTLICSESMCVNMLDYVVKNSNIILNPSAYGELKQTINYPLFSNDNSFNDTIFLIPNISLINDTYEYGRSMIMRGNTIIFEKYSLENMLIIFDTETHHAFSRH